MAYSCLSIKAYDEAVRGVKASIRINYRVAVGVIGCEFGVKHRSHFVHNRMAVGVIGCEFGVKQRLYFAHYRIVVGVIDVSLE